MSSAEISMMILTFIAVDRFITILFGLHQPKCPIKVTRIILIAIWLFGVAIAIIPALLWGDRMHAYYGNNGVCLPLYLQEPHLDGWIYSLSVLIGLNGVMIVLIILSYAGIFICIRKWRQSGKPVEADESQERELLWRFFGLVFVNLCCWIPTFVFKILALTSYKVPGKEFITQLSNQWINQEVPNNVFSQSIDQSMVVDRWKLRAIKHFIVSFQMIHTRGSWRLSFPWTGPWIPSSILSVRASFDHGCVT